MFEGMPQAPIRFISMDTPHVHRMALWLSSLAEAYKPGDARRSYYHAIKQRLSVQFSKHALVLPDTSAPFWKTTNYLDGVNGVYRWHYATTSGSGYGPYEGSGAMTLGWWSFLHTTPVRDLYRSLAEAFPLKANAIATYVGPNTSRKRNPLVTEPACYTNGFRELLSRLAYQQTFQLAQDKIN